MKEAQRLGYAEADPSFDIEGHDTAQKLVILASIAFGTKIDPRAVYSEGIASITPADLNAAAELGYRVKLLGVAVKTAAGIEQRVHPTMVPRESAIAQVMGVTNAVTIDADGLAPITLIGPGAGGEATASAIIADLADIGAFREAEDVFAVEFRVRFGRDVLGKCKGRKKGEEARNDTQARLEAVYCGAHGCPANR